MSKIGDFFTDVKIELGKVTWPTGKQTLRYTITVVVISIAVAIFLGLLDAIFGFGLEKLIS